jgi:hypothetical protein
LGPGFFVAVVWAASTIGQLSMVHAYGSRFIPHGDDWDILAQFTGRKPITLEWLWSQHNEHRVALPRLILLSVLKISGGDFRAVMYLNALAFSSAALALLFVAGRLRGRVSYWDTFTPMIMMSPAHHVNLLNAWQVQMVASMWLLTMLFCILVTRTAASPLRAPGAIAASTCLLLLPLCGANGVAVTPVLAMWFLWTGISAYRSPGNARIVTPIILWTAGFLALVLTGLYFLGYQKMPFHPDPAGFRASARGCLEFLACGFGEIPARHFWPYLSLALFVVALSAVLALAWRWITQPMMRTHVIGLAFFLLAMALLCAGTGWGRSGFGPGASMNGRYVAFAVPSLYGIYLAWVLVGGELGNFMQATLAVLPWVFLWPTTTYVRGVAGENYHKMLVVEREIQAGEPIFAVANRHYRTKEIDRAVLEWSWLRKAGINLYRSFGETEPAPIDTTLDVTRPGNDGVFFGRGWQPLGSGGRSMSNEAVFYFRLKDVQPVRLRMLCHIRLPGTLWFRLNTASFAGIPFSVPTVDVLDIPLPLEFLHEYNTLTITLNADRPARAKGAGDGPATDEFTIQRMEVVMDDSLHGRLETASADAITGWAVDNADPGRALQVEIYDGESLIATVLADEHRPDLVKAGVGTGRYGFSLANPALLKNGRVHEIRAVISGRTKQLDGSPKPIVEPAP